MGRGCGPAVGPRYIRRCRHRRRRDPVPARPRRSCRPGRRPLSVAPMRWGGCRDLPARPPRLRITALVGLRAMTRKPTLVPGAVAPAVPGRHRLPPSVYGNLMLPIRVCFDRKCVASAAYLPWSALFVWRLWKRCADVASCEETDGARSMCGKFARKSVPGVYPNREIVVTANSVVVTGTVTAASSGEPFPLSVIREHRRLWVSRPTCRLRRTRPPGGPRARTGVP